MTAEGAWANTKDIWRLKRTMGTWYALRSAGQTLKYLTRICWLTAKTRLHLRKYPGPYIEENIGPFTLRSGYLRLRLPIKSRPGGITPQD